MGSPTVSSRITDRCGDRYEGSLAPHLLISLCISVARCLSLALNRSLSLTLTHSVTWATWQVSRASGGFRKRAWHHHLCLNTVNRVSHECYSGVPTVLIWCLNSINLVSPQCEFSVPTVLIWCLNSFPELLEDSEGGPGTITWVDPED